MRQIPACPLRTLQLDRPDNLPATLDARFATVAGRLADLDAALPPALAPTVAPVAVVSDFVAGVLQRDPEALAGRVADASPLTRETLAARVAVAGRAENEVMRELRRHRQLEMGRIAWRDLAGWATLEDSLRDLSALADGLIAAALEHASAALEPRFGRPVDAEGKPAGLLTLGLGKLGGRELNFSSDIDLVFAYPDDATLPGSDRHGVEEYFRRLAQTLIKLLDQVTADGFVFRVDTRLRPFGTSGPLVISLAALEAYLAQHGRDWERYAYVKARLVTGRRYETEVFDEILTPFVFRRYLDFGVFEALRQMKQLIASEVERKDRHANIKLGAGGIREIEFIAQVFQLVRGGQSPELRVPELLEVLPRLRALDILSAGSAERLTAAYRYLRTVENRLQAMDDRQTHELPAEAEQRERLAYAMGLSGPAALERELANQRSAVSAEFARIAFEPAGDRTDDERSGIVAAWEAGRLEDAVRGTTLAGDAAALELLGGLRGSGLYARMDEPSRQRLSRVIARIVPLLDGRAAPATVLGRVLPLLQAICRRSAYLALLNENPTALERLLGLAGESPMLARQMAEHPLLLDELLDARLFDAPPTRAELEQSLAEALARVPAGDIEAFLEALRRFQRAAVFRIAIADKLGGLELMKVSDRLTDTAELVLAAALDAAWRELETKYGKPMHGHKDALEESGFAVIAYGKLGGLELGYGSDLDLVFLHDSSGEVQETAGPACIDNQRFFARLAQRLIHFLSVQTSTGRLYEIDTRLRPSGSSGLMVSSLKAFRHYQREQAWTWEHQALLRSRSVAGRPALREAFERERREVLVHHVERAGLRQAIADMRERMRRELSSGTRDSFDLKQDPGGLADIEFLVDYWVLANAPGHPELVTYPDNVRQLEALEAAGLIAPELGRRLKDAYLALRTRIHELALAEGGKVVPAGEFAAVRADVTAAWSDAIGGAE